MFSCFLDNLSRITWMYLLKKMSFVPCVIELFYIEINNQFSTCIRILYTDNVMTYMKTDVFLFCTQ